MPCVPLTSASPSLALSWSGSSPADRRTSPAGRGCSVDEQLAAADEREREVRERGQVARRAERTLLGHDGDQVAVQHLDHALDDLGADARVPEREHVRAEQQHRARLLARERRPDGGGVRTHDPELERVCLVGFDALVRERAEPGRHAVDGLVGRDGAFDHVARGTDPARRRGTELDLGAERHLDDVLERREAPRPGSARRKATEGAHRRQAATRSRLDGDVGAVGRSRTERRRGQTGSSQAATRPLEGTRWLHRLRPWSDETLSSLRLRRLFTSWFRIRDRCPRCGLRLEREEGGFLGAMTMNYIVHGGRLARRARGVARRGPARSARAGAHDHVARDRGLVAAAVLAVLEDDLGERRLPDLPDEPGLRIAGGRRPRRAATAAVTDPRSFGARRRRGCVWVGEEDSRSPSARCLDDRAPLGARERPRFPGG